MKKNMLGIYAVVVSAIILFGTYIILYKLNRDDPEIDKPNTNTIITKEEYVYKEELLKLGYKVSDVEIIENKIKENDVKTYLLDKKYDTLTEFVNSPYFKIENISRYENYYEKNSSYTTDEVVLYVEIGLDIEFYTNIKDITDYNEITALVNKYNRLPSNFKPDDLVSIPSKYKKSSYNYQLRKEAEEALEKMIDAAAKDNIKLWVVSAYRTESTQKSLFNNSKNSDGLEHALIYSAKPRHSEHQLGLAVDLNKASSKAHFEKTKEYEWLKDNAYKYGFMERYLYGKEFITGYGFEPWHYRYFGIELATNLYKEGCTNEEYLVKHSV